MDTEKPDEVRRLDKYRLEVGIVVVTASPDQEDRIRDLTPEQMVRFQRVMGGGS